MALGRRAFTHDRVQDINSIMFPKIIYIDGKPLDHHDNLLWGKDGWTPLTHKKNIQKGVGGVAGIWHSNNAGIIFILNFYLSLKILNCFIKIYFF